LQQATEHEDHKDMEEDPDKLLAMIRSLRMKKDLDPDDVLAALAEMRTMIPPEFRRTGKDFPETTSRLEGETEEDFVWNAAQEATDSFLAEVQAVAQAKRQQLFENALDLYYAMEEASCDPKNAQLLPELERMRAAYLRDYGHPIPAKEETEARRRMEREET
jgi:hypothetical protein